MRIDIPGLFYLPINTHTGGEGPKISGRDTQEKYNAPHP